MQGRLFRECSFALTIEAVEKIPFRMPVNLMRNSIQGLVSAY